MKPRGLFLTCAAGGCKRPQLSVLSQFECSATSSGGPSSFNILPSPPWGRGVGGEGVNALKPETAQPCPQVSGENAGRRVVVAQCFQRSGVNCKRRGAGPPPRPAPAEENAGGGPLSPKGERAGGHTRPKKSQHKCRNSRDGPGRGKRRPHGLLHFEIRCQLHVAPLNANAPLGAFFGEADCNHLHRVGSLGLLQGYRSQVL